MKTGLLIAIPYYIIRNCLCGCPLGTHLALFTLLGSLLWPLHDHVTWCGSLLCFSIILYSRHYSSSCMLATVMTKPENTISTDKTWNLLPTKPAYYVSPKLVLHLSVEIIGHAVILAKVRSLLLQHTFTMAEMCSIHYCLALSLLSSLSRLSCLHWIMLVFLLRNHVGILATHDLSEAQQLLLILYRVYLSWSGSLPNSYSVHVAS